MGHHYKGNTLYLLTCSYVITIYPPLGASGRVSRASGCVPLGAPLWGVPLACLWGVPLWGVSIGVSLWLTSRALWRASGVPLGGWVGPCLWAFTLWGRSGWGGKLSIRDSRTCLWGRGTARWFGLGLVIGSPPSTGVVGMGCGGGFGDPLEAPLF